MRKWKVPTILLGILILTFIFRWGNLGSTTNNGTIIKTKVDHWNGSVWQTTIKNGSYNEKIVSPSWFESMRKPIEKTEEYREPDFSKSTLKSDLSLESKYFVERQKLGLYDYFYSNIVYVNKTRTIQVPPPPIYWLSSDGLTKIWVSITSIITLWLLISLIINKTRVVKAETNFYQKLD